MFNTSIEDLQATSSTPLFWKGSGSSLGFSPGRMSNTPQNLLCFALSPGKSEGKWSHNHQQRTCKHRLDPSPPHVESIGPLTSLLLTPLPVPTSVYSTFKHGSPTTSGSVKTGSLSRHVHPHTAFILQATCPQSSNELAAMFKKIKPANLPPSPSFTSRYLALTHTWEPGWVSLSDSSPHQHRHCLFTFSDHRWAWSGSDVCKDITNLKVCHRVYKSQQVAPACCKCSLPKPPP